MTTPQAKTDVLVSVEPHLWSEPRVVFHCTGCRDRYVMRDDSSGHRVAARLRSFRESHLKSCRAGAP